MPIPWRVSLNASTDSNRRTASSGRKSTHSRPHRKRWPEGRRTDIRKYRRAIRPCRFGPWLRDSRSDHQHQPQATPHSRAQEGRDARSRQVARPGRDHRDRQLPVEQQGRQVRIPDAPPHRRQPGWRHGVRGDDPLGAVGLYGYARRLAHRPRGDAVRSGTELRQRHQHGPGTQSAPGATRLCAAGRSGPFTVLCKSGQDGGTVRPDRHGQPVHRLDRLACLRGTGQRRDFGLRERGA